MNFSMKKFYMIGTIIMILSVIGGTYDLMVVWDMSNIGMKLVKLTSVLFNMLLVGLFIFLYKQTPDMTITATPDLDKLLDDLQNIKEVN